MRPMGKLSLTLIVVGTAACGSDNNNTADAHVVVQIDARPIDAPKVFNDAPPATYDFSCFGVAPPTMAPANVTLAGTTETANIQTMMLEPVAGVTVDAFKTGNATSLGSVMSGVNGTFMTADLATAGAPIDGYIRASKDGYRTTYLYPPGPLAASAAGVPVPILDEQTFGLLVQFGLMATQDDATNGFLLVQITDCAATPAGIPGATLVVKQGGSDVGTVADFSQFSPGTFAVTNVPDGDTTISATYNNMTFPAHVVTAHKKPTTTGATGTITASVVRPGPV
jgi:hypothetical protein